ncbi:hypothetical protein M8494_29335 [Serratia ureilytica]
MLLWPTLWALWLAGKGVPRRCRFCCVRARRVPPMRAAGCVVNDYADRAVDGGYVKRTARRPMRAAG